MDSVLAIYLLGTWRSLKVEVRTTVFTLGAKTAALYPPGTTSLEDSLHYSNNDMGMKAQATAQPGIRLLAPAFPCFLGRCTFMITINRRGLEISATDAQVAAGMRGPMTA